MSIQHDDLLKTRESMAGLKGLPSTPSRPGFGEPLSPRPFAEKILDQVTDVLTLLLTKENAYGLSIKEVFDALERKMIVKALSIFNGHQKKTANFFHLIPTTFCAKMKKHKIVKEYKGTAHIKSRVFNEDKREEGRLEDDMSNRRNSDMDETRELSST